MTSPPSLSATILLSIQADVHAYYILAYLGPFPSSMGSDQGDRSIYGILVTSPTSFSTFCVLGMQESEHAHYFLVCLAHILAQWGLIREVKVSMESL